MTINTSAFKQRIISRCTGLPDLDISELASDKGISFSDSEVTIEGVLATEAKLTLRSTVFNFAESLDDRDNPRWRVTCIITVDIFVDGQWQRHPRGALRILRSTYNPKEQELNLELGCIFSMYNYGEAPFARRTTVEPGTTLQPRVLISGYLESVGLPAITVVEGDPILPGTVFHNTYGVPVTLEFAPKQGNTPMIQHVGKMIWANHQYFLWVDNQERIRVGQQNVKADTPVMSVHERDTVIYERDLSRTERVAGKIEVSGIGKQIKPYRDPQPVVSVTSYQDGNLVTTLTQETDRASNTINQATLSRYKGKAVFRGSKTRYYDSGKRLYKIIELNYQSEKDLGISSKDNLTLAKKAITDMAFNTREGNVIEVKTTTSKLVKKDTLEVERVETRAWQRVYRDVYQSLTFVELPQEKEYKGGNTAEAPGEGQPPAIEYLPPRFTTEDVPISAESVFQPTGTQSGNPRLREINLGEYGDSYDYCKSAADTYGALLVGNDAAFEVSLPIDANLLANWRPYGRIDITEMDGKVRSYLMDRTVWQCNYDEALFAFHGVFIGTVVDGALDPAYKTFKPPLLSTLGVPLLFPDGREILAA